MIIQPVSINPKSKKITTLTNANFNNMKTIKLTDLCARNAYINASALIKLAQNARGYAVNALQNQMGEVQSSNGKGIAPGKIDAMQYTVQALQEANQILHCLEESGKDKSQRNIHIVRDDITIPDGYKLIGQFAYVYAGDMEWDYEACNWKLSEKTGFAGESIIIRKEIK